MLSTCIRLELSSYAYIKLTINSNLGGLGVGMQTLPTYCSLCDVDFHFLWPIALFNCFIRFSFCSHFAQLTIAIE